MLLVSYRWKLFCSIFQSVLGPWRILQLTWITISADCLIPRNPRPLGFSPVKLFLFSCGHWASPMPRHRAGSSPLLAAGYGNWAPGSCAGGGTEHPPGLAVFFPEQWAGSAAFHSWVTVLLEGLKELQKLFQLLTLKSSSDNGHYTPFPALLFFFSP